MVSRKTTQKWNTIRVRESIFNRIDKVLNTKELKDQGISNISQFVTNVITDRLDEYSNKKPSYIQLEKKLDKLLDHINHLEEMIMKINFPEKKSTYNNFRSVIVKDTYIEIFDDGIRNGIPVKITYDGKKIHCEECESFNCNHIKHILSIEHISDQLEERGLVITEKICPKCGTVANKTEIDDVFGYRKSNGKVITQSWCRYCRTKKEKPTKRSPSIDKYF